MIETAIAPEIFAFPHFAGEPEKIERRTYFSDLIRTVFIKKSETRGSVVMFSSPNHDAGVSYIASCVAVELAQAPEPILLADAHAINQLALVGPDHLTQIGKRIGKGNVWVLGTGQIPSTADLAPATASARTADVMALLRDEFTHIVIDGPAINYGKDTIALVSAVDGIIFVAKAGSTGQTDLMSSYRKIKDAGGRILGSVLNCH